jgi:hypothetical protein
VPHGTPDYGVTGSGVTVYQVADMGELAARLGSPITHDRRGDVIWWDDAECGIAKWAPAYSGGTGTFATSTARARNGRCSFLITPFSGVNAAASMVTRRPYPALSRLGLECSLSMTGEARQIDIGIAVYDGVNLTFFNVRWDSSLERLEYQNAAAAFVVFATGVKLYFAANLFHTLKLVADPVNRRYHRLIVNEAAYDLRALVPPQSVSAINPHVDLIIREETLAVGPLGTYVDDVVYTVNEPASG